LGPKALRNQKTDLQKFGTWPSCNLLHRSPSQFIWRPIRPERSYNWLNRAPAMVNCALIPFSTRTPAHTGTSIGIWFASRYSGL
jgi:hypothetical protein